MADEGGRIVSENTKIEWADATVNWWAGCTAISPACDHCYAKKMAGRLWNVQWGSGQQRLQFTGALEALRALDRKAKRLGRSLSVFHNSLSDFFDNEVPPEWREAALEAMAETQNLIHLLLTKRPQNIVRMVQDHGCVAGNGMRYLPGNVWLGTTAEDQKHANIKIPALLNAKEKTGAARAFVSMEPLLGPVDQTQFLWGKHERVDTICQDCPRDADCECGYHTRAELKLPAIDWVIVGGESGPGARPMHPDWARSLRDQCAAAGVAFLFKQWGEWLPISAQSDEFNRGLYRSNRAAKPHEDQGHLDDCYGRTCTVEQCVIQADGSVVEALAPMAFRQGAGSMLTFRVGKKAAGRLLDGRTFDEVPS